MTVTNEQFAAASKAGIESFFSIANYLDFMMFRF